jgi:hypothetical protein
VHLIELDINFTCISNRDSWSLIHRVSIKSPTPSHLEALDFSQGS